MTYYRLAGQDLGFSCPVLEADVFKVVPERPEDAVRFLGGSSAILPLSLLHQAVGWVAGAQRQVETWTAPPGFLLRVENGSDFYISPGGQYIIRVGEENRRLTNLDRDILLGPVLVLALAMQSVWSLHASATILNGKTFAFLGESGQGKSTLAAYLTGAGWQLVADDILPVTGDAAGVQAWPRFPQLKLPIEAQPGVSLPEQLPLESVCILEPSGRNVKPAVKLLSRGDAVKALLAHTAGARLFSPDLLGKHLEFCTEAACHLAVYHLAYPHHREALPLVKDLLESLC